MKERSRRDREQEGGEGSGNEVRNEEGDGMQGKEGREWEGGGGVERNV